MPGASLIVSPAVAANSAWLSSLAVETTCPRHRTTVPGTTSPEAEEGGLDWPAAGVEGRVVAGRVLEDGLVDAGLPELVAVASHAVTASVSGASRATVAMAARLEITANPPPAEAAW